MNSQRVNHAPADISGTPVPVPLPFDDGSDAPIGFSLTARARRAVAPTSLPDLTVVGPPTDDDPSDTRAARARALRRAGFGVTEIAGQLAVDDLIVRAWVGDVAGKAPRVPVASRAVRAAEVLATSAHEADGRFADVRARACAEGRVRLRTEPSFAAGVGLLAGVADVDRHAVSFRTVRPELVARVLDWARATAGADERDVRIVLRTGSTVAGDLTRHRWSSALGLPLEQVASTRWPNAPASESVEALVRIADPALAGRVAGWCDAFVEPDRDPADLAF